MKYFKGLLFILLIFFSLSAFALQNSSDFKWMVCSDKCDGVTHDGHCVPVINLYKTNEKDQCENKIKEGARNIGFALFIIIFLTLFLSTYRVPNFQQEDVKRE